MQTNKTIHKGEKLHILAQNLLQAAYDYWEQYQKDLGSSAIVWLESESGHFVLFTRSEYKEDILAKAMSDCAGEPVMFEPFTLPKTEE